MRLALRRLYPRAPSAPAAGVTRAPRRACDTMPSWRGEAISQTSINWVGAGFVLAASWSVVTVISERLLEDVHQVPLDFLVRTVAIGGLIVMTVPLRVLHV